MNSHSGPTIDDVRSFWDANPWTYVEELAQ